MMVLCNAIDRIDDDRGRSGLPSAPVVMKYNNSSIE